MSAVIYHGTPMTPRAALNAILPGRGACVSFYRPDDVEAVEAVCPTIMFRQRCLFGMDGGDARGERMVHPRRLGTVLSVAGEAAVLPGAMGCIARRPRRTFPTQRWAAERLAFRSQSGCACLAYGWAAGKAEPPLRTIRPGGPWMDRPPETAASGLPRISQAHGRGRKVVRQLLASDPHDAGHQGRPGLSLCKRRQHVAGAERSPL